MEHAENITWSSATDGHLSGSNRLMSGTSSALSSLSASAVVLPDPAGPVLRGSRREPAVGGEPANGAVRLGAASLWRKPAAGGDATPGWLPTACRTRMLWCRAEDAH